MRAARAATLILIGCLLVLTPGEMRAQDMDGDGVLDAVDICKLDPASPSPCGFDTDNDGIGNMCDGDFNNDGVVDASDSKLYWAADATGVDPGNGTDMNCGGLVSNFEFFLPQLAQGIPGPSGLACAGVVPCP